MTNYLKKKLKITILLYATVFLSSNVVFANNIHPKSFKATYLIKINKIIIGSATQTLYFDKKNHYKFIFKTHSTFPFINLKSIETSEGNWNSKGPQPITYTYHYMLFSKKRNVVSKFHWHKHIANTVQNKIDYKINIPKGAQDKLSYQLAIKYSLMQKITKLSYSIVGKHGLHIFKFNKIGNQLLKTPIGKINTICMKQSNKKNKELSTIFWLAPKKYDYLLMKIDNIKNGKVLTEANLKSVKFF